MKRKKAGWPPSSSAKHAVRNAKGIERAIAEQERRTGAKAKEKKR